MHFSVTRQPGLGHSMAISQNRQFWRAPLVNFASRIKRAIYIHCVLVFNYYLMPTVSKIRKKAKRASQLGFEARDKKREKPTNESNNLLRYLGVNVGVTVGESKICEHSATNNSDEINNTDDVRQVCEEIIDDCPGDAVLDNEAIAAEAFQSYFSGQSQTTTECSSKSSSCSETRGNSGRTQRRKNKIKSDLQNIGFHHSNDITEFFPKASIFEGEEATNGELIAESEQPETYQPLLTLDGASVLLAQLPILSNKQSTNNTKNVANALVAAFEVKRATAVKAYLEKWAIDRNNFKKYATSIEIAKVVYSATDGVTYRAKMIRYWANYFRQFQALPDRHHGQHSKVISLITHEDIASRCHQFIKSLQRRDRLLLTSHRFMEWVNRNIPEIQISAATAMRWLKHLGYQCKDISPKGIYFDGHEREDVVYYRQNIFLPKMFEYKQFMADYENNMVTPPQLPPRQKEMVLVVHDECIFHANDSKTMVWVADKENIIRPKGEGQSIMISQFLCPCHGVMAVTADEAKSQGWDFLQAGELIHPGKNVDGYWTNDLLINQIETKVIPIFNYLHPNKIGVFAFDNSQAHSAYADDALRVSSLNLGDGLKPNKKPLRTGYYTDSSGQKRPQPMQYREGPKTGMQKGLKTILVERGLWEEGMMLKDAVELLAIQPDFAAQANSSWLQETINKYNHRQFFFPKFHPEFNFIERYWGMAKRYARAHCDYSFAKLSTTVGEAFQSISLQTIRNLSNHCWRYMKAYKDGNLSPAQVEWAMKKYSSHRRIKENDPDYESPPFLTPEFMEECPN